MDPTAQPTGQSFSLATRPQDLRHKRLGLIDNTKANASALLEAVAAILEDELEPAAVVRHTVPISMPAEDTVLDEIASEVDLVIEAVGD